MFAIFALSSCTNCNDVWKSALKQYKNDGNVNQLLLVKCTHDSYADIEFYVKDNGKWTLVRSEAGYIGKNGLGKQVEGDMLTPDGDFAGGPAFGIKPNPGTAMEYIDVTESIYGCSDDCEYYNKIIDTAVVHHTCTGEHMIDYVPAYNYGFRIDYNHDCVPGLGNSIFFHCTGNNPYTAGCVAVEEDFMKEILMKSDSGIRVIIHRK